MMTSMMRGAVDGPAHIRGRSTRHLLIGLTLAAGAVLGSSLLAGLNAPGRNSPGAEADHGRPDRPPPGSSPKAFALIWPPLFLALTVSGLRIWNAPRSRERTQALTLWGVVQALNAAWMALGPGRLGGQLAAAVASLATSAAYAWRARRVDPPAANMVAPYVGWVGVANVLSEELWRRNPAKPTLH